MNKGSRYREQVLDEAFFGEQMPWTDRAIAFELSLHVAAPQAADGSLTAEVAYPGYQRVRLGRDRRTWRRVENRMTNLAEARFALCQADGKRTATHWALTPLGQPGPVYHGRFAKPLEIAQGIRPVVDAEMIEIREE